MKFIDLMKKINPNTPIEIYYHDCEFVNQGTAREIKRMYAYDWFLAKKEIVYIEINEESKALMITLIKN